MGRVVIAVFAREKGPAPERLCEVEPVWFGN